MIRPEKEKLNVKVLDLIKFGITFKHSTITENIIGEVKEFDDNTVHKSYGELEKPIPDLENGNNRIDALDILILLYDFPKWNQIREVLGYGYWYSDNLTIINQNLKSGN